MPTDEETRARPRPGDTCACCDQPFREGEWYDTTSNRWFLEDGRWSHGDPDADDPDVAQVVT